MKIKAIEKYGKEVSLVDQFEADVKGFDEAWEVYVSRGQTGARVKAFQAIGLGMPEQIFEVGEETFIAELVDPGQDKGWVRQWVKQ